LNLQAHILSILIFLPIVSSIPLLFFNRKWETLIKSYSLVFSLIVFAISIYLYFIFNVSSEEYQFIEKSPWIQSINSSYYLGIDGISLLLILLTTFIMPISILASWNTIKSRLKEFYFLILLLEGSLIGVFASLDLILFYVFWEFILIPMYFLIGIWGAENRIYATLKFFIFTMFGSVLLLVGIIWLVLQCQTFSGVITFELPSLVHHSLYIPVGKQIIIFVLVSLGFLIKIPLFPFHTWLPDAHVQAPTAGSVILAALLLKMGTYGLLRFSLPLFPMVFVKLTPYIAILAVIGIIYGALLSIVQKDIKKLIAYSSVSHLGFIVLGIFALTQEAVQGSVIQMINHGLSTGALFLIVGMIYERRHTKAISEFGGLMKVMPVFSAIFLIICLSSIGLPGLNGFIGEFLVLVGSFNSQNLNSNLYTILSSTAVILSAVYLLWLFQRVMLGPIENENNREVKDISKLELSYMLPILLFVVWIGVQPNTFLKVSENSVKKILVNFNNAKSLIESQGTEKSK
jgi:NADH-quinone oxidoreductase subunit M